MSEPGRNRLDGDDLVAASAAEEREQGNQQTGSDDRADRRRKRDGGTTGRTRGVLVTLVCQLSVEDCEPRVSECRVGQRGGRRVASPDTRPGRQTKKWRALPKARAGDNIGVEDDPHY